MQPCPFILCSPGNKRGGVNKRGGSNKKGGINKRGGAGTDMGVIFCGTEPRQTHFSAAMRGEVVARGEASTSGEVATRGEAQGQTWEWLFSGQSCGKHIFCCNVCWCAGCVKCNFIKQATVPALSWRQFGREHLNGGGGEAYVTVAATHGSK